MAEVAELTELLPALRQILAARGLTDDAAIQAFLYPDYDSDLHDPFGLKDMDKAVARIEQAIDQKQQIAVYGDYDIDGLTATAVLYEALTALNARVMTYIPDRFEEGYGLNQPALAKLKQAGVGLVITVDCGITAKAEVEWAQAHDLDIIVTDHHAVPADIPPAVAVINPKQPTDSYPFKDLAGVGVAFKLVQALQQRFGQPAAGQEKWWLDLVALGTVCDIVPLVGENRVLTKFGLMVLNRSRRIGLRELAEAGSAPPGRLTAYHLGWVLGPRLNAAGRLEHAQASLELLLTADSGRARQLASDLNNLNRQRIDNQQLIFTAADAMAAERESDPILVLAAADWSHGIVGVVASRIMEKWHKPTILMQVIGSTTKGSARSLGDFNMIEALRAVDGNLVKYGGHFFAAGCTLKTDQIDQFRADLNAYHRQHHGDSLEAPAERPPDLTLEDLSAVDWPLFEQLQLLEPCGNSNQQPLLLANLKVDTVRSVGKDGSHLKLQLSSAGRQFGAMAFRMGSHPVAPGDLIKARFHLSKNEYNGQTSLELIITNLSNE